MNYNAFMKAVMKEMKKHVLTNEVDENDVMKLKYKNRFKVEIVRTTGLLKDLPDRVAIHDTAYYAMLDDIYILDIYNEYKAGKLDKIEALNKVVVQARQCIDELIEMGIHCFDSLDRQIAIDKELGIETDIDAWLNIED